MMELLNVINIQTAIFLIGVSVLIQSGLLWLQSMMIQEYRGIRTAALGNLLFGIGMLLTSFRGIASDFLTIILANYLVAIGTAALYVAVCRFVNERYRPSIIVVASLPVLVLLPYYTFVRVDFVARIVIMGLNGMILVGALAVHLFRLRHGTYRFSVLFLLIFVERKSQNMS